MTCLTTNERDILRHTSRTGRYVTHEDDTMKGLVARKLLLDYGPQTLAGGMHYYTLTVEGRAALRDP